MSGTTYTTYAQQGQRQDLDNMITTLTPDATPFVSKIGSEPMKAKTKEWQQDTLDPARDNAQIEGADAAFDEAVPTTMLSNKSQIFRKAVRISGTADAISVAGRAKETGYQVAKQSKAIKKDVEFAMVGQHMAAAEGDGVSNPRRMASAFTLIDPATTLDVSGGHESARRELQESDLLALLQTMYEQGAQPKIAQVRPSSALTFAGFAYSADGGVAPGRVRDVGASTTIVNTVDVYRSPFGRFTVELNRILEDGNILLFDPAMWKRLVLRPYSLTDLARTGDNTKKMLVGEFSLKHNNTKASGVITGLTKDGVPQI